jgi:hypothetical protein
LYKKFQILSLEVRCKILGFRNFYLLKEQTKDELTLDDRYCRYGKSSVLKIEHLKFGTLFLCKFQDWQEHTKH